MIKNDQTIREYVQEKIQQHRQTFDVNNPKDFIDMYILMTKEEKSDSFSGKNFIIFCKKISHRLALYTFY